MKSPTTKTENEVKKEVNKRVKCMDATYGSMAVM